LGSNAILNKAVKEVGDVSSVLERRISSRNIAEEREFLGRLKTAIYCGVAHHCGVRKTLHMGHFFRGLLVIFPGLLMDQVCWTRYAWDSFEICLFNMRSTVHDATLGRKNVEVKMQHKYYENRTLRT
jgi:hypothetical protein